MDPAQQTADHLPSTWLKDVQSLFRDQTIQEYLIAQINDILAQTHSVIVIYQKLFIKFKTCTKEQSNLYMLKISKSFPLDNSLRLYLLEAAYQPKICDTRDITHEVLGKTWNFSVTLKQVLDKIASFQSKMALRNEDYMAMQKTGDLFLGDVFVYNELQEHSSLSLFVDKSQPTTNILNAVSETHLLVFQRVVKKAYKSKEEEEYEMKSKTLYGKKFMLSKFCELQCISSMQVSSGLRQVVLGIVKYRSLRSVEELENGTKKIGFSSEQSMRQFIRIVLKNLPKYQATKITFLPSHQKTQPESKEDISPQRILEMNQLEQRLQSRNSSSSKISTQRQEELINRLNKSYQKMIEYYSARANPYYLIYVHKLNLLYQTYFLQHKDTPLKTKSSFDDQTGPEFDTHQHKKNLAKSLSLGH